MEIEIYRDFVQQMKTKYGQYTIADLAIYYRAAENPQPAHLAGEELIPDILDMYFAYDGPKYVVAEGTKPLRYTERYFSRLIYPARLPGKTVLFVLSSEQQEAYEAVATSIINDINQFKRKVA